ncbi:MAG: hypothetical protein ACREC4_09695 [Methylocella sp.]
MVKMRAPDGISSIVHNGVEVQIADDRSVEVDDVSAGVFKVHGFRPWNDGQSALRIDAVPHSQMVLPVLERIRRTVEVLPTEELRTGLATAPATVIPPEDTETGGQEQDISGLNRPALFAFLRAKGVSVSLPVTNEELRAAARRAHHG